MDLLSLKSCKLESVMVDISRDHCLCLSKANWLSQNLNVSLKRKFCRLFFFLRSNKIKLLL